MDLLKSPTPVDPIVDALPGREESPSDVASLFREHNAALLRFAAARLGSEHEAREVAQEAYVRLLQLDRRQTIGFLRAYLFKTAANLATDRLRARRRAPSHSPVNDEDICAFDLCPERHCAGEEMIAVLNRALADTYIAGSPSIWWGSREILAEIPAFDSLQIRSARHRRLPITVGGLERALAPEELRATLAMGLPHYDREYRKMDVVGNARRLAAELKPLATHGLQVVFTVFPDETHSSAIPAYIGRGARFTLLGWDGKWIAGELARYRERRERVRPR